MAIDFLAFEIQFLDHAAPVYLVMADRGQFFTTPALADHARTKGIDPTIVDAERMRKTSPPPKADPGDGPIAFATSIGDIKIGRRLGYRRFVFMEHGAGQAYIGDQHGARDPSYSGGIDREDVELFLVPNEYSAALWRSAYPSARVEVVGSPHLDDLPRRQWEGDPAYGSRDPAEPHASNESVAHGPTSDSPGRAQSTPVVCISFHWPATAAPEADTALGHYFLTLKALAARYPGTTLGHAHPKGDWPRTMARVYERAGIEWVPDFDDVCRRADVYICDNSSTLFEFASTGRPVVVLNQPSYRRNVRHGLRYWDAADVGIQVDEPAELLPAVERALRDAPAQQAAREAALDIVYAYRHGAAERAVAAIQKVLWVDQAGMTQWDYESLGFEFVGSTR